jgi:membrane protein YdbS with pleckstrin-like domain
MVHDQGIPQARVAPTGVEQRAARFDNGFSEIDLRRVRRYLRLAAVIPALLLVASPVLVAWLLVRFFDVEIGAAWLLIPTGLLIAGAARLLLKSERRLRTYYVQVAHDALVYDLGQSRTFLGLEHVQIIDHEASLLLRLCGLCRLSLHTAGGTVIVSPLPVWVPPVLEERIRQRPRTAPV